MSYLPFKYAKEYVSNLKIANLNEWEKYCKSPFFPFFLPYEPHIYYRNDGCKSAKGFFGSQFVYQEPKKVNLPFVPIVPDKINYIHLNIPPKKSVKKTHPNQLNGLKKRSVEVEYSDMILIEASRKFHGDKYMYPKLQFDRPSERVVVTCFKHGDFMTLPHQILSGVGCLICYKEKLSVRMNTYKKEDYLRDVNEKHNKFYKYDKLNFTILNDNTKQIITCPIHGDFKLSPQSHLKGTGCPTCKEEEIHNNIIDQIRKVHDNRYCYYNNSKLTATSKLNAICHQHGKFQTNVYHHSKGQLCPECSILEQKRKREAENNYLSYKEARNFVRGMGFKNGRDYLTWWNRQKPSFLPKYPNVYYTKKT